MLSAISHKQPHAHHTQSAHTTNCTHNTQSNTQYNTPEQKISENTLSGQNMSLLKRYAHNLLIFNRKLNFYIFLSLFFYHFQFRYNIWNAIQKIIFVDTLYIATTISIDMKKYLVWNRQQLVCNHFQFNDACKIRFKIIEWLILNEQSKKIDSTFSMFLVPVIITKAFQSNFFFLLLFLSLTDEKNKITTIFREETKKAQSII